MKELAEAVNNLMGQVGYVQKQGASGLRYTFAGERALIAAIRPHMVKYGLFIAPVEVLSIENSSYTTKNGAVMMRAIAVIRFELVHTSGQSMSVTTIGEGADSGDKATNKAMTAAYKYAMRQLFCIETGDDPDEFESVESVEPISAASLKKLNTIGASFYGDEWNDKRHEIVTAVTKGRTESSTELTSAEADIIINGINKKAAAAAKESN